MESDDENNFYDSDDETPTTIKKEPTVPIPVSASQPVIMAEFCDGYSFRNLIEYLKGSNLNGQFRFTTKRILYEVSDIGGTVLNKAVIYTSELTHYTFNSKEKEIPVNFNLTQLRSITKSIGKKDSVRIYMLSTESILYIQIINHTQKFTNGEGGANIVRLQPPVPVDKYDVAGNYNSEENPNCRIPTLQFSKMCTAMHLVKSNYVRVTGYQKGVVFEGMLDGDIMMRIDPYGEVDNNNTNKQPVESTEVSHTNIKINIIKNLSKFNNLSPNGTVKIYFGEQSPVKLICNIGTYGRLKVYLRDFNEVAAVAN